MRARTHTDGFVHMHTITVLSPGHGPYRVLIAGMDDRADWTAQYVFDALEAAGDSPLMDSAIIRGTDEEVNAALGGMFSDDVSY